MTGVLLAEFGLNLLDRLIAVQQLQAKMAADGRTEPTPEEVAAVMATDDAARAKFQASIDAAKAAGG